MSRARADTARAGAARAFVLAEHEAVVLDGGAAARGIDHDGVEALARDLARPGLDIGPGEIVPLLPEVMVQGAAAARAARHDDLAAVPGEKPDGGLVDLWRQHPLGAAGQQRHALDAGTDGPEDLRLVDRGGRRYPGRRECQQHAQLRRHEAREGFAQPGRLQTETEHARPGQHDAEQPAQGAVRPGPHIGSLDVMSRMVDEMHVVHARRAGRHAGQARQATVDMLHHLSGRRAVVLQHVLDEVDAAARAVELVAEQRVGRAGRGAETAMHAGAQDLGRFRGVGVGELGRAETGLHGVRALPACGPG